MPQASGVVQQSAVRVHYNGAVVGEYFADLLVEDMLLIELKTVKALDDANFSRLRLEIKRVVLGL